MVYQHSVAPKYNSFPLSLPLTRDEENSWFTSFQFDLVLNKSIDVRANSHVFFRSLAQ